MGTLFRHLITKSLAVSEYRSSGKAGGSPSTIAYVLSVTSFIPNCLGTPQDVSTYVELAEDAL